jgi:type IV pilus assembly protein PilV
MTSVTPSSFQRGFALIESLIAIVVTALGILGILGVQMRTLSDTSTSVRRAQAIRLIEDLSERMRANPNALANLNTYVSNFATVPPKPLPDPCINGCDNAALAAYDRDVWKSNVRDNLPLGRAEIFIPAAEAALAPELRRQLGVMIAWRENERDTSAAYKDDIDATKVRDTNNNLVDGSTLACPANFVCHLQYLPVAGRCAPYKPGGNATTYYCPGA